MSVNFCHVERSRDISDSCSSHTWSTRAVGSFLEFFAGSLINGDSMFDLGSAHILEN